MTKKKKKNDLRKNEFNLAFYFRGLREHQMTAMAAGKEAERSQLNHEQEAQSELQAGQAVHPQISPPPARLYL